MDPPGPKPWFFDTWALFYDLPLVQRLTYRPVQDAVLGALRRTRPRRVLDVGCGTGLFASRLGRELAGATVVGCDFSHGMLRQAAAHARDAPWVQGNALHLPFRDASFDAVVCTEAFHWFPDQRLALAEFFRVLVPGGRALVALVNPPLAAVSAAMRAASRLVGEPFYWPTRAEMRRQVESVGFHVEAQRWVFRVPAGFLLPPVLTLARRPAPPSGRPAPVGKPGNAGPGHSQG